VAGCKSDYTAPCRDAAAIQSNTFSAEQLKSIPYTGHDTLVYVSLETNDSIVLLTETYSNEPYRVITNQPGNPECPNNDFITYDVVNTQLSTNTGDTKLFFAATRNRDTMIYSVSGPSPLYLRFSAVGSKDSTFIEALSLGNLTYPNVNGFANEQGDSFYVNGSFGLIQFVQNAEHYTLRKFNNK
jgi:hypothetical protein